MKRNGASARVRGSSVRRRLLDDDVRQRSRIAASAPQPAAGVDDEDMNDELPDNEFDPLDEIAEEIAAAANAADENAAAANAEAANAAAVVVEQGVAEDAADDALVLIGQGELNVGADGMHAALAVDLHADEPADDAAALLFQLPPAELGNDGIEPPLAPLDEDAADQLAAAGDAAAVVPMIAATDWRTISYQTAVSRKVR